MAWRRQLRFKKITSWTGTAEDGDVVFWVNGDGDLVRRDSEGVDTVIGSAAGDVGAHEADDDPHPQYLTASS